MRGYDLMKEWQKLPESEREYVVQWMIGAFDMTAQGFTEPHPDQDKAVWAIDQLKDALEEQKRSKARNIPPKNYDTRTEFQKLLGYPDQSKVRQWAEDQRALLTELQAGTRPYEMPAWLRNAVDLVTRKEEKWLTGCFGDIRTAILPKGVMAIAVSNVEGKPTCTVFVVDERD